MTSRAGRLPVLRHRRNEPQAFLYAFDLLELNGADLRREPIEVRKALIILSDLKTLARERFESLSNFENGSALPF